MCGKTPYVWSTKFTPVKKKFTQPLVVMVETFRMSGWYWSKVFLKGWRSKNKGAWNLKCSKSKMCRPKKLKLCQHAYLIRWTWWQCFSFLGLQVLDWEHFKVSGGLVFASPAFLYYPDLQVPNYVSLMVLIWHLTDIVHLGRPERVDLVQGGCCGCHCNHGL